MAWYYSNSGTTTAWNPIANYAGSGQIISITVAGIATKLDAWCNGNGAAVNVKCALYDSGWNLVGYSGTPINCPDAPEAEHQWDINRDAIGGVVIGVPVSIGNYYIVICGDNDLRAFSSATSGGFTKASTYSTFPPASLSGMANAANYRVGVNVEVTAAAALTGTAMASITETDIVTGGKTIIITLTGDEWIAS